MRKIRELQMLGARCRKTGRTARQPVAADCHSPDGFSYSGAERRGFGVWCFHRRSHLASPFLVRHRNTLRHTDNTNTGKHDFAGLSEVKNAN